MEVIREGQGHYRECTCPECQSILRFKMSEVKSEGGGYDGSRSYIQFKCPVCMNNVTVTTDKVRRSDKITRF